MPYLEGAGTSLFYSDWGSGRPVVLMHGWALSSQMWEGQVACLVDHGFRCITYDRRGHGRSDVPGTGYDYDTLAQDLRALLSRLELTDVVLVAHSMAAGDAVRYLSACDEGRVSKLVLIGGTTPFLAEAHDNPGGLPEEAIRRSRQQLVDDRPAWFADGTPAYFAAPPSADLTPQMQSALDLCLQTPLPVLLACTDTMMSTDLRHDVRSVDVPTLVVHGDADLTAPLSMTAVPTAALLPQGRLVVYPGAPHGLYVTDRDRLNADLLSFIDAG
jgi:non-heme chloroperoxidase